MCQFSFNHSRLKAYLSALTVIKEASLSAMTRPNLVINSSPPENKTNSIIRRG